MSWRVELLVLLLLTRGNVQGRQRRQLHVRGADLAVGLQRESALCLIWQPRRPAAAQGPAARGLLHGVILLPDV
jgi:hypothetical protein